VSILGSAYAEDGAARLSVPTGLVEGRYGVSVILSGEFFSSPPFWISGVSVSATVDMSQGTKALATKTMSESYDFGNNAVTNTRAIITISDGAKGRKRLARAGLVLSLVFSMFVI
jgi:hypothetical protein